MMDGLSEGLADMSKLPRPVPQKYTGAGRNNPDTHPPGFTGKATPYSFLFSTPPIGLKETRDITGTFPTSGLKRVQGYS
jgi:hypothetical protein